MASEIKKIARKEHDLEVSWGGGYEHRTCMYNCSYGEYISIYDLKDWLDWHLKERAISTIYSDLEEALK